MLPMRLLGLVALAALAARASALQLLKNEPTILYADVSPKLRIITKSSAFSGKFGLAFFLFFRFPIVPMDGMYIYFISRTARAPGGSLQEERKGPPTHSYAEMGRSRIFQPTLSPSDKKMKMFYVYGPPFLYPLIYSSLISYTRRSK